MNITIKKGVVKMLVDDLQHINACLANQKLMDVVVCGDEMEAVENGSWHKIRNENQTAIDKAYREIEISLQNDAKTK